MVSLKNKQKGFTIVELLIVIVVIGILAALVITTYAGIQSKARNAKRQTDVQSLQTQIEAFFSQNGYYPSLGDMNSQAAGGWLTTNMKSLDLNAMSDPSNASNTTLARTSTSGGTAKYGYAPTSDGTTVCGSDTTSGGTDTTCADYTLTATYEGSVNGSTTYTKKNLD